MIWVTDSFNFESDQIYNLKIFFQVISLSLKKISFFIGLKYSGVDNNFKNYSTGLCDASISRNFQMKWFQWHFFAWWENLLKRNSNLLYGQYWTLCWLNFHQCINNINFSVQASLYCLALIPRPSGHSTHVSLFFVD